MSDVQELERSITSAHANGDAATVQRLQSEYRKLATTRVSGPNSIVMVERSQSVIADSAPIVTESSGTIPTILVRPEARHTVRNLGLTLERESGAWLVGWEDRDAGVIVVETIWPGRPGSDGFEGENRTTFRFDAEQLGLVDERALMSGWRVIGDLHSHPQADAGGPSGPDEHGWLGQAKGLRQNYVGVIVCPHFADMLEDSDQFRRPQWSAYVATPDGTVRPTTIELELSKAGD